jgi:hypothetical protein
MSTLGSSPLENNASCFTTINPNHAASGSPARMYDGRLFTDYRPRCHQYPVKAAEAWGDNEYRKRMIEGAEEAASMCCCHICISFARFSS